MNFLPLFLDLTFAGTKLAGRAVCAKPASLSTTRSDPNDGNGTRTA